jgi:hypothetical protein
VCCAYLNQGRGLSPLPQGKTTTPNFSAQTRTLRIRQANGLDLSIADSTSPLRTVPILPRVIFIRFRGPLGALKTSKAIPYCASCWWKQPRLRRGFILTGDVGTCTWRCVDTKALPR